MGSVGITKLLFNSIMIINKINQTKKCVNSLLMRDKKVFSKAGVDDNASMNIVKLLRYKHCDF